MKKLLSFTVCLFVSFLFGANCSIFDLKDPARPLENSQEQDPLNIRSVIMFAAPEVAADMEYRYYFTDDAAFESFNFPWPQGKKDILYMLDNLRLQNSFVEWIETDAKKRPDNNLWIVTGMRYIVYSNGERVSGGTAEFYITTDCMISYWKDMPDDNANAFFKPF